MYQCCFFFCKTVCRLCGFVCRLDIHTSTFVHRFHRIIGFTIFSCLVYRGHCLLCIQYPIPNTHAPPIGSMQIYIHFDFKICLCHLLGFHAVLFSELCCIYRFQSAFKYPLHSVLREIGKPAAKTLITISIR